MRSGLWRHKPRGVVAASCPNRDHLLQPRLGGPV